MLLPCAMAMIAGYSLTSNKWNASIPNSGNATIFVDNVILFMRAVTGGITAYTVPYLAKESMVSLLNSPFPRCNLTPAAESAGIVLSISYLLLEVGPTPAGLTAV